MKNQITKSDLSSALLLLRVVLALVIFPHGAQKLFGWYGGYGFTGTMQFFTETIGMPWLLGFLTILLETVGTLALLAGLGTRALGVAFTFLAAGIVFTTHLPNGFFMNWFGNQAGEGYEYFILWAGMTITLVITGGGRYSLDYLLRKDKTSIPPIDRF
ncbi:MAG: DoxX family protein [Cyclobacteriaceae bacterium]|nr:DoxX family protein [Cyclobacteriaceae bacterium]